MADEFALPKSSYGELVKMIQAYFRADQRSRGEAVSVPDVASAAAMHRSLLSRNNKFFHSVGVIEGGQKKRLTELGRNLGLALSHADEVLTRQALGRLVDDSDFLDRIISAVRIRGGMDAPSLQTHIAITAGAPKSAETTTGTSAIVQLLLAAGRLHDDGGTLRAAETDNGKTEADSDADPVSYRGADPPSPPVALGTTRVRPYGGGASIPVFSAAVPAAPALTVNINLNIEGDNIEPVREMLRELLGRGGERRRSSAGDESEAS